MVLQEAQMDLIVYFYAWTSGSTYLMLLALLCVTTDKCQNNNEGYKNPEKIIFNLG